MRGKRYFRQDDAMQGRITPADAGKTKGFNVDVDGLKDHPRGCGENTFEKMQKIRKQGSPPRMRGKPEQYWDGDFTLGITPADAGKTNGCGTSKKRTEDHPRGCGENPMRRRMQASGIGSPPRMRGKPRHNTAYQCYARITPADAGKTGLPPILNTCY